MQTCFVVYSLHLSIYDVAYVSTSFIYGFSIDLDWPLLFPQLLVFSTSFDDRFTHGEQARRNGSGLGMAFDFEPWNPIHTS